MFDLDDTLVSRAPNIVQQANHAALQLLSSSTQDMEWLEAQLAHVYQRTTQHTGLLVPKRQQFTVVLQQLGQPNIADQLFAAYLTRYLALVQVFPDVHPALSRLVEHRLRIGIATNGPLDTVEAVLQHGDLHQYVDCIVTPVQAGAAKPSPTFATFMAAQTGVVGRHIILVGDSAADIATAQHIGATAVLIDRERTEPRDVTPDYHVQTLSDILPLCLATAS
jgi:HAD superfamily hydrolase (TIGR01549 family)